MRKLIPLVLALLLLCGCAAGRTGAEPVTEALTEPVTQAVTVDEGQAQRDALALAEQAAADLPTEAPTETPTEPPTEEPTEPPTQPVVVCIDAGHQRYGNSDKEPNGPGSSTMKAKVTGGATGTSTGQHEYELNLQVSLKLQQELEARGYQVVMVRTENDVDISNVERSEVANEAGADVFIRVHANGASSSSAHGAMTICMTSKNPYNGELHERSRALSEAVLDALTAETGCRRESVWETDTMTGINWSEVPVTIVEMGYLSNPEEDRLMATEDYQWQIARGIANGIDDYCTRYPRAAEEEGADYGG